jgi:hypothetical protein
MDNKLSMNEREDRLRLIIQHSLSETIREEMKNVVSQKTCNSVHEALTTDRKERGQQITEMRTDFKSWQNKIDSKFDTINLFVIGTLISSLGALIMAILGRIK